MTTVNMVLKHVVPDGTYVFFEGDDIICYLKDGVVYKGRIASFCSYIDKVTGEEKAAICLNTSISEEHISGEIIKLENIGDIQANCETKCDEN